MKLQFSALSSSILAALMLSASSLSHAEDLSTIYRQAINNDHEFKAAEANYRANKESKNLQRAGLLPRINGSVNWSDEDSETVRSTGFENGAPFDENGITTNTTDSGYSVSLSQPLFDMAAWYDYKAGKATSNAAEAQYKTAQQNLIIRTATAYFDALQAADNLQTNLAIEAAFEHQLEQSRQRFEVGLSAITEVHEAQAVYDSAVADRLTAQGQLGITFEALEVLTGQPYDSLSPIKDSFVAIAPVPAAREEWVARAIENNFTLKNAKENAKAAKQTAKSARSGHLPTLSLSGSYSKTNRDSFTNDNNNSDTDRDAHGIGLELTVPIFNGGSVSASSRRAKYQAVEARERHLQTKRDIIQSARSNHLAVMTSVATIKARKQAIVSNQSALDATQAGYSVGTRNLVDVLNAQRGLHEAEFNYHNALYTYVLNTLRLKESAGTLSEEDLNQLNAWLDSAKQVSKTSDLQ